MVSVLEPGVSCPGLSPGSGHYVLFLGKRLYFHSTSLHPSVKTWVLANLMLGVNPVMD